MSEKNDSKDKALVVDTGVLVEFLEDSKLGRKFLNKFLENEQFERYYISPLTTTELKYIFCRKMGYKEAKKIVKEFLKDFIICSESDLRDEAICFKCDFPISLADSYTLAVALLLKIPLCMKKEKEIEDNFDELCNKVNILLIDKDISE